MFQDEKTTELNLNPSQEGSVSGALRWTETSVSPRSEEKQKQTRSTPVNRSDQTVLLKFAALVSILLLSLWLL